MAKDLVIDIDYDVSKAELKQKKLLAKMDTHEAKIAKQKIKIKEMTDAYKKLADEAEWYKKILDSTGTLSEKESALYGKKLLAAQKSRTDLIFEKDKLNEMFIQREDIEQKIIDTTKKIDLEGAATEGVNNASLKQLKTLVSVAVMYDGLIRKLNEILALEREQRVETEQGLESQIRIYDNYIEEFLKQYETLDKIVKLAENLGEDSTYYQNTQVSLQQMIQEAQLQRDLLQTKLQVQRESNAKLQEENNTTEDLTGKYDALLAKTQGVEQNTEGTAENVKETKEEAEETDNIFSSLGKNASKFSDRVMRLAKRVLVFSVITRLFRAFRNEIGEFVKQDEELNKSWLRLQGSAKVLSNSLLTALKPVIQWLLDALTKITNFLVNIFTIAFGLGLKNMKDMTTQTKKAGQEAKKALAGFDTLQQAINPTSSDSGDASATAGTDDSDVDTSGIYEINKKSLAIGALIVGAAAIALGVLLCCAGQWGYGIGLIALGAISLVTAGKLLPEALSDKLGGIMSATEWIITSGLVLVGLGIILCCAQQWAIGLGLIIAGAALLWGVESANPDDNAIGNLLKRAFSGVEAAMTGLFLIALGVVCLCAGIIPVGIGLIVAGAIPLFSSIALNWSTISNWLLGKLKWLLNALKEMVNGFIGILNGLFGAINDLIITPFLLPLTALVDGIGKLMGKHVNLSQRVRINQIPYLADGAVIPGGSPFMAMLGDQPKGQTNIEAPLETLVEAFKQANQNSNITLTIDGNMADFVRAMNPVLKQENRRASMFA